jgi:hypothetical protein
MSEQPFVSVIVALIGATASIIAALIAARPKSNNAPRQSKANHSSTATVASVGPSDLSAGSQNRGYYKAWLTKTSRWAFIGFLYFYGLYWAYDAWWLFRMYGTAPDFNISEVAYEIITSLSLIVAAFFIQRKWRLPQSN